MLNTGLRIKFIWISLYLYTDHEFHDFEKKDLEDPNVLTKSDEDINRHTREITSTMRGYPGFIFNLGHGITPNIHPDKIKIMIDSVRNFEN